MKNIKNTNTPVEKDIFLEDALINGQSVAIERQESEGQKQLVTSDVIPTDMYSQEEAFKRLGFELLGVVEDDPLFQYAKLPDGWKKVATTHSMWSDIVDASGKVRAVIFYKAAFYDRAAFIKLV